MRQPELSYDEVSEAIAYDPEVGRFYWKVDASKNVKKGSVAGTLKNSRHRSTGQIKSYLYIRYKDREMVGSRVAWLLHYGEWPTQSIMFIDGDSTNLKINNLRLSHATEKISKDGRVVRTMPKDAMRGYALKRYYGMSLAEYSEMYRLQDGKCAICKQPETNQDRHGNVRVLAVDHCHATGSVRKLLCYACNSMLGQAKDNPDILIAGAEYLRESRSSVTRQT
jgi:hypothetical protein